MVAVRRQAMPLLVRGNDSYMAVSFLDGEGNIMGHVAVFDERPILEFHRRFLRPSFKRAFWFGPFLGNKMVGWAV